MTDALGMCGVLFEGRLLTIYTKDEDEYIRILLQIEGIGPGKKKMVLLVFYKVNV